MTTTALTTVSDVFRFLFSREVILYLIFGVLTTLVNLVIFTGLSRVFGKDRWYLSNGPAILLAILFAFVTNRGIVFQSTGPWLQEMIKFFTSRLFVSVAFEYGGMYLFYNLMKMKSGLKLAVSSCRTRSFWSRCWSSWATMCSASGSSLQAVTADVDGTGSF